METSHINGRSPPESSKVSGHKKRCQILKDTRQKFLSRREKYLYCKVIESCNKLGRFNKRVSFKSKLAAAEKLASSTKFQRLVNHANPLTYSYILSQVQTQNQKPKRFTLDEKLLALCLLKASAKGYRLLSKIFTLPSRRTLTNLLHTIPFKSGVNKHIFDNLEKIVRKMKPIDRYAILIFDEMFIESDLNYDSEEDEIIGIEDLGNGKRKTDMADHVHVFMVKGTFRQWKQPLCYTFSGGPMDHLSIKNMIKTVIRECHRIGLKILATVCDQAASNQKAIQTLMAETNECCIRNGIENTNFGFLVDNEEIVPLFDTPHLFKCLRNNLLTKNLHFIIDGKKNIAKWDHIEQFYYVDTEDQDVRVCPKLNDQNVIRTKINKMKVKCCTQVFSHQVGALIKRIISWKAKVKLDKEAVDTANLILFLDKLFDSLNSSKKFSFPGKPLKGAVTAESDHVSFWYKAIHIIESMKFEIMEGDNKGKFAYVPTIKNLILTLRGFIHLSRKIFNLFKNKYILTRVFQQDALTNFFSSIRGSGYRENLPSASNFQASFKALITNNFMSIHSAGANCEEDESEGPLSNLRELVTGDTALIDEEISQGVGQLQIPASIIIEPGTSKIARCTLNYISGFIMKKVNKQIKCDACRKNMSFRDQNIDIDFIQACQYANCKLAVSGTVLNFLISQSISILFYMIPRLCHLPKISSHLENNLSGQLHFSLINCKEHQNTHKVLIKLIIKCCLYFWCKRTNLVSKGKDEKFIKFLNMNPNKALIDPVKKQAHDRYKSKISYESSPKLEVECIE